MTTVEQGVSARRWLALLGAGWIGAMAALTVWLRTPVPELREHLRSAQFWSLEATFFLLIVLGGAVLRDARRLLSGRDLRRMGLLVAAALCLTLFVAPRTSRIYYDEQIYQSIGQNLSDLKLAQMCNDGTVEYGRLQCWLGEYNKQPYAYPHLLSAVYRIAGVSEGAAFAVNAAVMALTVCGVYVLTLLLFADTTAALFAGLIMLLVPQQIMWSATAAVEPSASLACVVALLMAAAFARSGSTVALFATAVAAAYAVQFRPESFLILPVAALIVWFGLPPGELDRPRFWAAGLLGFVLLAVHLGHLTAVRGEGWGTTDARISLAYVTSNLRVNGWYYLADERFPTLYTLLAAAGLAGRSFRRERLTLALYFVLFFGMYLLFYAGSYNYGADVRYSLMTYPPLAALGGLGAAAVLGRIGSTPDRRAVGAAAAALAAQFLWYAPLVRATTEEAWPSRADVRFARTVAPELRGNAYVLTHNPGMFHLWGVNAGQMSRIVQNPSHLDFLAARYAGGGVYLHWNFWCNVADPLQQGFCRAAMKDRPFDVLRQHRERDQVFAFFRYEPQVSPR